MSEHTSRTAQAPAADHSPVGGHSHGTMGQLMIGFGLAAILTIIPFYLVMAEVDMGRTTLIGIIMGLGAVQIIVHLVFFLHVNRGAEEGWTLSASVFSVIILGIVLAGSLWVMHNMNENMMPMHEMDRHIEQMKSLRSQQG
ncbi:cytochrome O ubiquinol oxidase [Salipiger aestuarii]|uniref:Cytochrome bo(3) ubiquinol oxidase subunit 4 n=1 Tax=Salipiger aestuarii TaxID=568098 RepID=A0A327Y1Q3_9RHOB|nr:cytochrome o ubiquinol oxidase subunit IV [Salipiger aestuarii]EIE50210.1 cytochrome C oxidase subunit IV [Citreicella sp. 357]KAA8606941.1 cytochrome O ubiquinol oxidase [Salipiger aestuarii]KAA8610776.1 cytochrome O ubiquinol oxidase [Salipiger aestuarii]KAB2541560.1 cytochrome O ubiquinol oxidase [Salipiger aestuarii]RAK14252.1 cytochrome o ubiquinol oxidase operon protein cyoD [Salipiger aestuarii]